jgi:DNA (cytosine-5)-methyltransferase 1
MTTWTSLEVCAGGGGLALGLERAGFAPLGLVDSCPDSVATLRANRPGWPLSLIDLRAFDGGHLTGRVDLLAAGVPCPPFSVAGRQHGLEDARDLFPSLLDLAGAVRPRGVLVCGLASAKFAGYLAGVRARLQADLGLETKCAILRASDFGVAQLRPRLVLVALEPGPISRFTWPSGEAAPVTVGQELFDLMAANGWPHAEAWREHASSVGPTLVGGSRRHGGPDLGPTRARARWSRLGVDGRSLAQHAPHESAPHFLESGVRLTLRMVARLQGFPDGWQFCGNKTAAYRQMGNAFPPPVAAAVAGAMRDALGPACDLPVRRTA